LKETLEEMEEVLETLELAEREKIADERELEQLRRTLRGLHRGRDSSSRYNEPRRPSPVRSAPISSRDAEAGSPPAEPEPEPPLAADEPQPS